MTSLREKMIGFIGEEWYKLWVENFGMDSITPEQIEATFGSSTDIAINFIRNQKGINVGEFDIKSQKSLDINPVFDYDKELQVIKDIIPEATPEATPDIIYTVLYIYENNVETPEVYNVYKTKDEAVEGVLKCAGYHRMKNGNYIYGDDVNIPHTKLEKIRDKIFKDEEFESLDKFVIQKFVM